MAMSYAAVLPQDSLLQPLLIKDEIKDSDLAGIEVDHRKRRRNRTAQSCLNCHISKRKCDRKRPCQRCIQQGMTGLCVYEVEDPTLRDDPNIDEKTLLRNRIAELESLVRELRGKPHPRWAESKSANEMWFWRSFWRPQHQKNPRDKHDDGQHPQGANDGAPSTIKTEQADDYSQQHLDRFAHSPMHPAPGSSSELSYGRNQQVLVPGPSVYSLTDDLPPYSSASSASVMTYDEARHGTHGLSNGEYYYQGRQHEQYMQAQMLLCSCSTNPVAGAALIGLTTQLQNVAALLLQLPEHNTSQQTCAVVSRITELADLMHENIVSGGSSSHEGFSTMTETELNMALISTWSQLSTDASALGIHEQWPAATMMAQSAAEYDPYPPSP